jgi:xanthine dehydrogenase accessory factor
MRDIWDDILTWEGAGRPFAMARVVETWGSSPRQVGAAMIVGPEMEVAGSVSGGCIEGAVITEAQAVLADGEPRKLHYGVSDETAWSVGLTCGGEVSVFVEKHLAQADDSSAQVWKALRSQLEGNRPAVLLTRLGSTERQHLLIDPEQGTVVAGAWDDATPAAMAAAAQAFSSRQSAVVEVDAEAVFVQVFPRQDRLLVVGASHISIPLVRLAQVLDLETIVIDPREVFARAERFQVAPARLEPVWPARFFETWSVDESTYAVLLTHDPKIDDEALHHLLRSPAAYVGALGSRRSHAARVERLQEAGFTDAEIARIRGPVGLDIGAESPEEIALSILAEVVATRRGNL